MKRAWIAMLAAGVMIALPTLGAKPGADGSGLVAHYYSDPLNWDGHWPEEASLPDVSPEGWTFTRYAYSRVEPVVNHLFVRRGWFSVRWKGYLDVYPPGRTEGEEGTHTYFLEILADDGCRLFIDGRCVIDDWRPCWEELPTALRKAPPIELAPGKHRIVVEYFQGQSLTREADHDPARLYWSCPSRGIPRQIIPASHFTHTEDDMATPGR